MIVNPALKALGVLLFAACLSWSAMRLDDMRQHGRLLRTWPEQAARDATLVRLAAAQARPLFAARCAACHGADMHGDTVRGVPDLTDADWLFGTGSVNEIEQTILYGIRSGNHRAHNLADMPAFGNARPYWRYDLPTLTQTEIADVTQYLISLGRHAETAERRAAARGLRIYNGKAQCYDCHTSDARGDSYVGAANLTDDVWLNGDGSPAAIAMSIEGGRAGICPAWTGRLSAAEVRALAVFIHAVSHGALVAAR